MAWEERDDCDLQKAGERPRRAGTLISTGIGRPIYCTRRRIKSRLFYPLAHYEYWRAELPDRELPSGSFGENFTVDGLVEDSVYIGDRFAVGSAEVMVTEPRLPCFKLGSDLSPTKW